MEYKLEIWGKGATWGIVIFIEAETFFNSIGNISTMNGIKINQNVFLQAEKVGLIDDEIDYLILGIIKVYPKFSHFIETDKILIIKINNITFAETDYQKEGLFCAIIGWLAQRFDFEQPSIPTQYIKSENKYLIGFVE